MLSNVEDRVRAGNISDVNNTALRTEIARMTEWTSERVKRSKSGVFAERVTLTPVLAAILLSRNPHNRNISAISLSRMASDMAGGRWRFNGEPIIVAKTGELNDGQHRCKAVVDSGVPIDTLIVFGADRDTRDSVDSGRMRKVGDVFAMHAFQNVNALAAMCTYIWQHQEYGRLAQGGTYRPTKAQALLVAESYKKTLPDSLSFVDKKNARKVASTAMLAFCHWAIRKGGNPEAADTFINRLIDGTNLREKDAALYARNRLIDIRSNSWPQDKAELIFRAYNAERRGEPCTRIVLTGKLPKLEK